MENETSKMVKALSNVRTTLRFSLISESAFSEELS